MMRRDEVGDCLEMVLCNVLGCSDKKNFDYKKSLLYTKLFSNKDRIRYLVEDLNLSQFEYVGHTSKLFDFYRKDKKIPSDPIYHNKNSHIVDSLGLSVKGSLALPSAAKIAVQIIGQKKCPNFINFFNLSSLVDKEGLKKFFLSNPGKVITWSFLYTFHTPMIYFNGKELNNQKLLYIVSKDIPNFSGCNFYYSRPDNLWSTVRSKSLGIIVPGKTKAVKKPLLEIQFHGASRTNLCIRFNIKNLLDLFPDNFSIRNY
jgi:hypothetical protein